MTPRGKTRILSAVIGSAIRQGAQVAYVLSQRRVILGITGGIAAYKAAELARSLSKAGAQVQVVMTDAAKAFVTP